MHLTFVLYIFSIKSAYHLLGSRRNLVFLKFLLIIQILSVGQSFGTFTLSPLKNYLENFP